MSGILRTTMFAMLFGAFVLTNATFAQDPVPTEESLKDAFPVQKQYSPYAGRNFPTNVYWGDTHLHAGMSMDAGAFGARLIPDDAYRFARGEELTSSTGLQVKLSRPLDFLVVADHSDNMGFFPRLYAGDPELIAVWKDPDFYPKLRAVYYGRVIEIPTPRWTAYEAKRFGVTMPPEVPMVTQERAYTSPIWYTP